MWALVGNSSRPPSRPKGELPPLLLRLTNFLGYLFLILVNILSSTGALGRTNGEISGDYQTPLTPSGWAFAIWGLIFALEGLGVIYQIVNGGYREGGWKTTVVTKIGYGWQAGWLFQNIWQFCFARENVPGMWLAAFALVGALAAFQVTLHRLNGTTHELRGRGYQAMPVIAYVFYKLPTAINAAWLSVATALGLLILPVAYEVDQARLLVPAAVLTVVVTAGGAWRLMRHRDAAYGFTLIWALSAVASNDSGNVPQAVKVVGIVCLALLALLVVSALVRIRRQLSAAAYPAEEDGSLLSYKTHGSYGNERMLLSDSDAFAGDGRGSSGTFTFPVPVGIGFHQAVRYPATAAAAAPDGLAVDFSSGRRVADAAAGVSATGAAAAAWTAGNRSTGSSCGGIGACVKNNAWPAHQTQLQQHAQQDHQQQQPLAGGDPGGSLRGSQSGAAGAAAGGGLAGAPAGVGGSEGIAQGPSFESPGRTRGGALGGSGGGGGPPRRVRFDDEDSQRIITKY